MPRSCPCQSPEVRGPSGSAGRGKKTGKMLVKSGFFSDLLLQLFSRWCTLGVALIPAISFRRDFESEFIPGDGSAYNKRYEVVWVGVGDDGCSVIKYLTCVDTQ